MEAALSLNIPSPFQTVKHPLYTEKNVQVMIKRDDLIHPEISGNKWRKLKYNIIKAKEEKKGLITFGGAFSNHIYATAFAAKHFCIDSIGIIRGDYVDINNPTLSAATQAGMELQLVPLAVYKQKEEESYLKTLRDKYPDFHIIPEGGNNEWALRGIRELGDEISEEQLSPDLIAVSAGTATTALGLLSSIPSTSKLLCFSSLKGDFLKEKFASEVNKNWELNSEFHFGGYGKVNSELVMFMNAYKNETGIPLDPIYTAKMLYGLHSLLKRGEIAGGSNIVIIHTGGLQGILGHNARYRTKEDMQLV